MGAMSTICKLSSLRIYRDGTKEQAQDALLVGQGEFPAVLQTVAAVEEVTEAAAVDAHHPAVAVVVAGAEIE
jgi:hypothetical protein